MCWRKRDGVCRDYKVTLRLQSNPRFKATTKGDQMKTEKACERPFCQQ